MKYNSMMPLRQADARWGSELLWDRAKVIAAHTQLNGKRTICANKLLRKFPDGNSIGNEGCLLTCISMVLRKLYDRTCNPSNLNRFAIENLFYTACGLSMVPLYADLASDVSQGQVQLCLKEEYLAGEPKWRPVCALDSPLVRAYLSLSAAQRKNFSVMLKTGTYDDSVASHYVILDPRTPGNCETSNLPILDPAMPAQVPLGSVWRLKNSAKVLKSDSIIKTEWSRCGIQDTQISGVWVFARRVSHKQSSIIGEMAEALYRACA